MKSIDSFINTSKRVFGFIDEKGNFGYDFENEGVSKYFIITAVLVEDTEVKAVEDDVKAIWSEFFQTSEIKFSGKVKNHSQRLLILERLAELKFKIVTVVVDKRKIIQSSGLGYKNSYIKYLNSILYEELHNYFPKLNIVASGQGSKDFMEGFRKYILTQHIPNLFGEYEFGFVDSKSEILIQLADFICETITLGYENEELMEEHDKYMTLLGSKMLPVVMWPYELDDYIKKLDQYKGDTFDKNIAYNSVKLATKFVEHNAKSKDPEIQERVYVLKYLLNILISQRTDYYVSSRDLINNLHEITGKDYTPHYFKTRIIAKLRDAGVLISSTQSGYKIPVREKEVLAFVNQTSSMVKPMIERLKICRDRVLSATGNEFDVLSFKEYEYLKSFLDE